MTDPVRLGRACGGATDNIPSLDQVKDEIHSILSEIHRPSSFACCGVAKDAQDPELYLNDHGAIDLPLSKSDAEAIISKSKQSPFGRGSQTIVDTLVRNSWQLDPSQFAIRNPRWDRTVRDIVAEVYSELSPDAGLKNVSAQLYKLLLYEEGAFFKPHRDSEKAPGMFGTLVLCLPSPHKGGEIILTFNGETKSIQTAPNSKLDMSYAAWNADVLHEVKPIVSGYRLVLTYNLIRLHMDDDGLDMPQTPFDCREDLIATLIKYQDGLQDVGSEFPNFLIHRLEHQYTQASLRASLLKGADLGQIQSLKQAADNLGFGLYLASMEMKIVKSEDDYEGLPWRKKRYYGHYDSDGDEDDRYGVITEEEILRETCLAYVVKMDGTRISEPSKGWIGVDVEEEMIVDPATYSKRRPDEEEHSGYTGNEGCTATFWYHDTVAVIVPPLKRIDFLYQCDNRDVHVSSWIQQLRNAAENDEAAQHDLRDLCQIAVANQQRMGRHRVLWTEPGAEEHKTTLTNEVLAAALQCGRFDLYDKTVERIVNPLTDDVFRLLGRTMVCAVSSEPVKKRVENALCVAKTLNQRHESLMALIDGIKSTSTPEVADTAEFKAWSKQILIQSAKDATGTLKMSKPDGVSLADIITTWEEDDIEEHVLPALQECSTSCEVAFANSLMRDIDSMGGEQQDSEPSTLSLESRLRISRQVYADIWDSFKFDSLPKTPAATGGTNAFRGIYRATSQATSSPLPTDHLLDGDDLAILLERTISLGVLAEAETKSRLRTAVLSADRDACYHGLLPFVELVLRQQVEHLRLDRDSNEACEEDRKLVTGILLHFVLSGVGTEPSTNFNWSQPTGGCRSFCLDCSCVNDFLADPARKVGQFPMGKARRHHLHTYYTNKAHANYSVTTLRNSNPNVLQITKNPSKAQRDHEAWKARKAEAKEKIAELTRIRAVDLYVEGAARAPILAVDAAEITALARRPLHAANLNLAPAAGSKRAALQDLDGEEDVSKKVKTDAPAEGEYVRTNHGLVEIIDLT